LPIDLPVYQFQPVSVPLMALAGLVRSSSQAPNPSEWSPVNGRHSRSHGDGPQGRH
jgi:hypothetical protein